MIEGLGQIMGFIQSPELRRDIKLLHDEMLNKIVELDYKYDHIAYSNILNLYVMGINRPICISDGVVIFDNSDYTISGSRFGVELFLDYQVTHGYKPYQKIDKMIHLYFIIDKSVIRDNKLNVLGI